MRKQAFCLILNLLLTRGAAAPAGDLITSLPGLASMPPFAMYSGYVTVNAAAGRHMHYWFAESASTPAQDPLLLWLTGGPGCSSLFALTTEHGPVFVNSTDPSKLYQNPYSWNAAANVIYLESPNGVGFSYSDDGNYTTGDDLTAADNLAFLVGWFKEFPEFTSNDFYLVGESYAGHYVPQLASLISNTPSAGINLKGFAVGNPSFDGTYDGQWYWPFIFGHGLVDIASYEKAYAACNGTFVGPLSPECVNSTSGFRSLLIGINPYNIYAPCLGPPSLDGGCFTTAMNSKARTAFFSQPDLAGTHLGGQTVVPCMNVTPSVAYFNLPAVRQALHIPSQAFAWDVCSQYVNYVQYAPSVRPNYLQLLPTLRILVYSGDCDSCVPFMGTQAGIDSLGLPVTNPYRQWIVNDTSGLPQIAGYVREYQAPKQLNFVTVKHAGHMVPTYQPVNALQLLLRFLDGGNY